MLFAKLDKDASKKVTEALDKLKGVDAKDSMTNSEAGEICVRIDGGNKVTADEVSNALRDAGITTQLVKSTTSKTN